MFKYIIYVYIFIYICTYIVPFCSILTIFRFLSLVFIYYALKKFQIILPFSLFLSEE